MCDRLSELGDALSRYAAGFDAALLSASDAEAAVGVAATIERIAGTLKGLAAARVAEAGAWKGDGERSGAHHLARATGSSVGQAAEVLETARRLERLPDVAAAALSGSLSAQQASAVADAATADPSAAARLLDTARSAAGGAAGGVRPHQGGCHTGSGGAPAADPCRAVPAGLHRRRGRLEPAHARQPRGGRRDHGRPGADP